MREFISYVLLAASALMSLDAFANAYNYSQSYPRGSSGAGDLTSISLTYDHDSGGSLSGSFSVVEQNNNIANTGWMVLTEGPNPKGREGDYGILYMDFLAGDSWLYQYNGQNNPSSYVDSPLLAYYESSVNTVDHGATRTVEFGVGFQDVQAPSTSWSGMSFTDTIGVWFHGLNGIFNADQDGINSYRSTAPGQFWHDTSNSTAHQVPEIDGAGLPLSLAFLLSAFVVIRQKVLFRRSA